MARPESPEIRTLGLSRLSYPRLVLGAGGGGGGGGGGGAVTLAVFFVSANATQAISALTSTEVVFGSETVDNVAGFASNRFTVPASLAGRYMTFQAGIYSNGVEDIEIAIEKSTDSGSTWTRFAQECDGASTQVGALTVSTGPLLLATGDIYRVVALSNNGMTLVSGRPTFFSGMENT